MDEKIKTTKEKRSERIAQLKAKLQKEQAKENSENRKERNGQLIAFGVYIEEFFKKATIEDRQKLENSIKVHLKDRNLEKALNGLKRLSS